ncbi:MAG: hypothetical protein ABSG94_12055, partial [Brevinematales bacterium]
VIAIIAIAVLSGCSVTSNGGTSPGAGTYTGLSNPEPVTISGYSGDAMEPFISCDSNYLFFNNNAQYKAVYYATRIDDTHFHYQGPISAINSLTAVTGTPAIDNSGNFYYIAMANYNPPASYATLYGGSWNGSTVTGITPLNSLTISTLLILYYDIDVSPDGSTLYLSEGDFTSGTGIPSTSIIVVAEKSGSGFTIDPDSAAIMANVNSGNYSYAADISADGLELFFTQYNTQTGVFGIYRAARSNISDVFGAPQLVSAITGIVEGPALSPDGKSLYYHMKNPNTGIYEIYRVTRP